MMKKNVMSKMLAATLAFACVGAYAQTGGNVPQTAVAPAIPHTVSPGYIGPSAIPMMTVADLLAHGKDDQYLTLRGRITQYLGDEDYLFVDPTGSIRLEIDHDKFPRDKQVGADTMIEITGEYEKKMIGHSKVEVNSMRIIAN
jgi:uncharacterized protein (TIGR00156 family)